MEQGRVFWYRPQPPPLLADDRGFTQYRRGRRQYGAGIF
ncbi:hypothetical protein SpAn4DRAFT_0902 [Sporomusa ovata]|uniref:Biopterin-dependent aromatic amino acid hydroxylase family profile domain-containing protein n=1 Tax=Sporomusa ovata TaxID=2378 RepID=A0A0U1L446_9FIRM|nr:hypothetical protein SpAn4DRAFT_0902 [Sporomusa ovata]